MLIVRDENNTFHSNFEHLQFILVFEQLQLYLTALSLSVWQDSSCSDMSALSGETTTTNGFDGRLFSFLVRATSTVGSISAALSSLAAGNRAYKHSNLVDNRDKRFPMPVRQARKRVSPVNTTRHSFFPSFHRPGYPKRKKANLVTVLYDWTLSTRRCHVYNVGSINDSGLV